MLHGCFEEGGKSFPEAQVSPSTLINQKGITCPFLNQSLGRGMEWLHWLGLIKIHSLGLGLAFHKAVVAWYWNKIELIWETRWEAGWQCYWADKYQESHSSLWALSYSAHVSDRGAPYSQRDADQIVLSPHEGVRTLWQHSDGYNPEKESSLRSGFWTMVDPSFYLIEHLLAFQWTCIYVRTIIQPVSPINLMTGVVEGNNMCVWGLDCGRVGRRKRNVMESWDLQFSCRTAATLILEISSTQTLLEHYMGGDTCFTQQPFCWKFNFLSLYPLSKLPVGKTPWHPMSPILPLDPCSPTVSKQFTRFLTPWINCPHLKTQACSIQLQMPAESTVEALLQPYHLLILS